LFRNSIRALLQTANHYKRPIITNGQSNSVTIFDLKTLAKIGEPATGMNPDHICFEPRTQRIFVFNGRSNDYTVIDTKTGEPLNTFTGGGNPESCVADGAGKTLRQPRR
jgi:YVTN family beta-propeller protein